jgi:hypothetical protein
MRFLIVLTSIYSAFAFADGLGTMADDIVRADCSVAAHGKFSYNGVEVTSVDPAVENLFPGYVKGFGYLLKDEDQASMKLEYNLTVTKGGMRTLWAESCSIDFVLQDQVTTETLAMGFILVNQSTFNFDSEACNTATAEFMNNLVQTLPICKTK